ncbi:hypothetical protein IFR04_010561 [Cadophora malorum]|uniref:Alternative oxidase n=1 Tax=Cadophora malorum TaxID=108018 RepID=A0A8H7T7J9_9HELO|nr:hypothetical protein IFR04_010561 [Cadophora malorum]|tara:strand:+ start:124 stop:1482 length:1359 start_codon:yes stop_codon:yes gene_type:complete
MQLGNGISRRYVILFSAGFIVIWLWLAMDEDRRLPKTIAWAIGKPVSTPENDVFDHPLLDSWELREICSSTEWNSSLILTCDDNRGGVGHVRNSILNCVRFAIGAGAGLVLPNIPLRDVEEMTAGAADTGDDIERRHGPGRQGMDYMFDKNHFVDSLRKSCPELVLVRHMEATTSNRRRSLLPESLFSNIPASGIEQPEEWRDRLNIWIEKYMSPEPAAEPVIVDLDQSVLHYPIYSDGQTLAHTFGDILKFRPDIRQMATKVLKGIAHSHDHEAGIAVQTFDISSPILNPSFIGVHLGTENPLAERHEVDVMYSHFEAQAAAYIEQATTSKIPIMYVASGNLPEVNKLVKEAKEWNVEVTHKEDVLQGKDADALAKLTWDQRALVDYLVLLKGQEFAGVGHSSFSWNIMLKRHQIGDGAGASLGNEVYRDGLSTLYGVRSSYVESSGCMWP